MQNILMLSGLFLLMFVSPSPFTMGLSLMMMSLYVVGCLYVVLGTTWYACLLFLVYVGGLLIFFLYMSMMSLNFLFKPKASSFIVSLSFVILLWSIMESLFSWKGHMTLKDTEISAFLFSTGVELLVSLVLLLLLIFFLIVRIIKQKGSLVIE